MHTAFIRITVEPSAADSVAAAMEQIVEPTRAEPGCLTYEFYRDLEDPAVFMCFEHWESAGALADHGKTPHVEKFLRELGPHITKWEPNYTSRLA
jgi:quinol monooxygenase YgiN